MTSISTTPLVTKYMTIPAGTTSVISKNINIVSIMNNGGVTYTTTCGTLPTPEATQCYELTWTYQLSQSSNQEAWEYANDHPMITKIQLGGVFYPINIAIGQPIDIVIKMKTIPQLAAVLLDLTYINDNTNNNFSLYTNGFKFHTTPTIAADLYVIPMVTSMSANTRIYPQACVPLHTF